MRRLRPRFTVRPIMVAVAIVGLLCGVEICRRNRAIRMAKANLHAVEAIYYGFEHNNKSAMVKYLENPVPAEFSRQLRQGRGRNKNRSAHSELEQLRRESESSQAAALYHARMRDKYNRAASSPWLAVDDDKSEPR